MLQSGVDACAEYFAPSKAADSAAREEPAASMTLAAGAPVPAALRKKMTIIAHFGQYLRKGADSDGHTGGGAPGEESETAWN